jgi:hypothetical protein
VLPVFGDMFRPGFFNGGGLFFHFLPSMSCKCLVVFFFELLFSTLYKDFPVVFSLLISTV